MTVQARLRFVPPPNWPQPPAGWEPPSGWEPPADWGPAPFGWEFWQPQADLRPDAVPGAEPSRPPMDGFAIATLIMGILASPLLSGIFGGIALSRIRKERKRGRALVFAGWAICLAWIAVVIAGVAFEVAQRPLRTSDGTVTSAGQVRPMDLRVGDCLKVSASIDIPDWGLIAIEGVGGV